jgi:hypothetical protein
MLMKDAGKDGSSETQEAVRNLSLKVRRMGSNKNRV